MLPNRAYVPLVLLFQPKCTFIKFAPIILPTRLFQPTRLFGTLEYLLCTLSILPSVHSFSCNQAIVFIRTPKTFHVKKTRYVLIRLMFWSLAKHLIFNTNKYSF